MERIQEAVERARQERARSAGLGGGARPVQASVDQIQYSQTRTVRLDPLRLRQRRILAGFEPGPYVDAFKMLRTQVLQRMADNGWNALAVTSAGVGAGATVVAINLAFSMALEVNRTVLLVDANLREPGVHDYLGIPTGKGLSDYLLGDASLPDLLVNPAGMERVVVLPGGRPLSNSAEMLSSPRMAHLVDELKSRYPERIVVFDLPPVLAMADALAFAPHVDCALLVIEEGGTTAAEAQRAATLLEPTHLLGTVLNKSLRGA